MGYSVEFAKKIGSCILTIALASSIAFPTTALAYEAEGIAGSTATMAGASASTDADRADRLGNAAQSGPAAQTGGSAQSNDVAQFGDVVPSDGVSVAEGASALVDAAGSSDASGPNDSVESVDTSGSEPATAAALTTASGQEATSDAPEPVGAADETPTGKVTVLHTNDIHGYYKLDARNRAIGFPILQTIKESVGPDLVLDAGDTFHGQSFATLAEGMSIATLMEMLGYDATTPGNHDWSYGAAKLKEIDSLASLSGFNVLAANVVDARTGAPYFSEPYIVKDVEVELSDDTVGTVQVGVLGVIDQGFYTSTAAANVADVRFTDPVAAANEAAAELRAAGCDVVIALTHNADPLGFARQTKGVDAVIAGHEHVVMEETVAGAGGTAVAVVEAGHYLQYAGVLDLTLSYDDNGTETVEDDVWSVTGNETDQVSFDEAAGMQPDPAVEEMVAEIEELVAAEADQVVGQSAQAYPYEPTIDGPGGWEKVRTEDTAIGHAVTAAYLAQTGADLALENAGGIRGGIPEGDVTAGDLLAISPYGNTLSTYQLTGAQIRSALETSLEISAQCRAVLAKQVEAIAAGEDPMQYAWPDESGSVLVGGGATMTIDWDKPKGQRIASISIGGQLLDPNRVYTVAMNSYLPQKTNVYPEFAGMQLAEEWGTCEQALRAFVGSDGWEERVYPLSGTVTYAGQGDQGEGDDQQQGGQEQGGQEQQPPVDADDPAKEPKPLSTLARTGDDSACAALALGAVASLAIAAAAVARVRERSARN